MHDKKAKWGGHDERGKATMRISTMVAHSERDRLAGIDNRA